MKAFSFRVAPNSQRTPESQPGRPQLLVFAPGAICGSQTRKIGYRIDRHYMYN